MTDNDSREVELLFCSGTYFPVTCIQYENGELENVIDHMLSYGYEYNPVFVSEGDHKEMIKALSNISPLSFARNRVWVMPLEIAPFLQLRLDNRILFYDEAASGGFSVCESYSIKGGNPITSQLFEWREGEDQTNFKGPIKLLERRWDLNRVAIKNAAINYASKRTMKKNDVIYSDLLSELQSQLNFNIQTVEPNPAWKYGRIQWGRRKNGTWNGLMKMLIDKRIEVTEAWMIINADRATVVDYSWATTVKEFTLCRAKTNSRKINFMAYVTVFPVDVLLIALALSIVAVICFSVLSQETIWQSLALILRLLLQIGYDLPLKNR